jgi:O-acetyl-ADP-ribose deacetylase (regulator of RNase III)
VWAYAAGILGAFLIVAALAWAIHRYAQPLPLGEDRAAVRAKALGELRAAEAEALASPAWVDQAKGIVRLPIQQAMMLVEREWGQSPAAARSNLIARVEKATAAAPKAPEKPSPFE